MLSFSSFSFRESSSLVGTNFAGASSTTAIDFRRPFLAFLASTSPILSFTTSGTVLIITDFLPFFLASGLLTVSSFSSSFSTTASLFSSGFFSSLVAGSTTAPSTSVRLFLAFLPFCGASCAGGVFLVFSLSLGGFLAFSLGDINSLALSVSFLTLLLLPSDSFTTSSASFLTSSTFFLSSTSFSSASTNFSPSSVSSTFSSSSSASFGTRS